MGDGIANAITARAGSIQQPGDKCLRSQAVFQEKRLVLCTDPVVNEQFLQIPISAHNPRPNLNSRSLQIRTVIGAGGGWRVFLVIQTKSKGV